MEPNLPAVVELFTNYKHCRTKALYQAVAFTKVQINDEWVEGVMYAQPGSTKNYTRTIGRFLDRFDKAPNARLHLTAYKGNTPEARFRLPTDLPEKELQFLLTLHKDLSDKDLQDIRAFWELSKTEHSAIYYWLTNEDTQEA